MSLPNPIFNIHDPVFNLYYHTALAIWLEQNGAQHDQLFNNTHLTKETLCDPTARVNYVTLLQLIENAYEYWGKPCLGLTYGRNMSLTSIGILGQASMSSHTIRDSCAIVEKYFNIRSTIIKLSMEQTQNSITYIFECTVSDAKQHRLYLDTALAGTKHILELLLGREINASATLIYDAGGYGDAYEDIFNIGMHFKSERNTITFYSKALDETLRSADPMTLAQAVEMCEAQIKTIKPIVSIYQSVLDILSRNKTVLPNLEQTASILGISARSLSRHLKNNGHSYSQCLSEIRSQEAKRLLRNTDFTITNIAQTLGYDSPANFTRAFKQWFAQTPSQYRNTLQENSDKL